MTKIPYYMRSCATCAFWAGRRKIAWNDNTVQIRPSTKGDCEAGCCQWPTRGLSNTRCTKHKRWRRLPAGGPEMETPIRG